MKNNTPKIEKYQLIQESVRHFYYFAETAGGYVVSVV